MFVENSMNEDIFLKPSLGKRFEKDYFNNKFCQTYY